MKICARKFLKICVFFLLFSSLSHFRCQFFSPSPGLFLVLDGGIGQLEPFFGSTDLTEMARSVIRKGLTNLLLGVHDERPVPRDGLVDGIAGNDQRISALLRAGETNMGAWDSIELCK